MMGRLTLESLLKLMLTALEYSLILIRSTSYQGHPVPRGKARVPDGAWHGKVSFEA
jgi:hypothetical protein